MSNSPGIRVLDVPKDASQRDLKVYFSNPRHGGAKISQIYYPLQGNDAAVLFAEQKVNPKIFQIDHVIKGQPVRVRTLQRRVFSKVTVELSSEITALLDNDPKYLDDIQYDGELEVTADDNYTITGDWYQIEWAWQYLDEVCNRQHETPEVRTSNGIGHTETPNVKNDNEVHSMFATKEEDELPLLEYPSHTELPKASGFQPYCYENWKDHSDYPLYPEETPERQKNYMDPFRFDDEEPVGLDFIPGIFGTGNEFPWMVNRKQQSGYSVSHKDFQDLPLTFDFEISSLKISVLMNDLLQEKVDAIVSSASGDLSAQFGISRVIARAADPKLREECREYIDRHGPLCIGDVIHTSAGGNLDKKVGFVIHAVGPSWKETRNEESSHFLTCTYLNILDYASNHMWLQNIAMPLIGAGGVGFPLDVCVQALYDALLLFVMDEKNLRHLRELRIVSNDEDSTCATIVVLRSLLDVDQIATQAAARERYLERSVKFDFKAKNVSFGEGNRDNIEENESKSFGESAKQEVKSVNSDTEENENDKIWISSKEISVSEAISSEPNLPRSPLLSSISGKEKTTEVLPENPVIAEVDPPSSDESIPFGMIDSDEEEAISKSTDSRSDEMVQRKAEGEKTSENVRLNNLEHKEKDIWNPSHTQLMNGDEKLNHTEHNGRLDDRIVTSLQETNSGMKSDIMKNIGEKGNSDKFVNNSKSNTDSFVLVSDDHEPDTKSKSLDMRPSDDSLKQDALDQMEEKQEENQTVNISEKEGDVGKRGLTKSLTSSVGKNGLSTKTDDEKTEMA